ncbi:MAG: DegQ family serine endoprotease [Deltaproteobacteria bacterium]|nr:DegQ family serine endoprotease [Deltaproteobacteria bacterium]
MQIKKKIAITFYVLAIAGLVVFLSIEPARAAAEQLLPTGNFTAIAQLTRGSVVNIRVEKKAPDNEQISHFFGGRDNPFGGKDFFGDFFGREQRPMPRQRGLGSGFVIDRDGYIVTNNHVVEGADTIIVTFSNKEEHTAKLVGTDPKTDLALIKVESKSGLKPLKFGDSEALEVGQWVVAVGSPFGLEQTVTAGIVSAKGRVIGAGPYDDFIQTDASINPGNSGGPLINMNGEVVGINTAIIAGGQGIGFAIPSNMAQDIIAQLKNNGEVTRAWLGVGIQDVTPELKEYYGLKEAKGILVTKVYEGSPADKGGIEVEDVITALNGKPIVTSRELSTTIAGQPVGKELSIRLSRNGKTREATVILAKRQDDESAKKGENRQTAPLGLSIQKLTPELADRLGYDRREQGVVVAEVADGSPADRAGIRQGDLIKGLNNRRIKLVQDVRDELEKVKSGEDIRLLLKRGNMGFIAVTIKK